MALMLEVSIPKCPASGARVRLPVCPLQSARLYPSVSLGRAYARVPQQLLNRPQVGAPLEKMRRERMPQCMRRHAAVQRRAPGRDGEPAAHIGGRYAPAALRDEHGGLPAAAAPAPGGGA